MKKGGPFLQKSSPNKKYGNTRDYTTDSVKFGSTEGSSVPMNKKESGPNYMKSPVKQGYTGEREMGVDPQANQKRIDDAWTTDPNSGDRYNMVTGEYIRSKPNTPTRPDYGERPVGEEIPVGGPKMKSSGFKMKEGSPFHRNFNVGASPVKRRDVLVTDPETGITTNYGTGHHAVKKGLGSEFVNTHIRNRNEVQNAKVLNELAAPWSNGSPEEIAKAFSLSTGKTYTAEDVKNMSEEEFLNTRMLAVDKSEEIRGEGTSNIAYTDADAQERQNLEQGAVTRNFGGTTPAGQDGGYLNEYYDITDEEREIGPNVDLYGQHGREEPVSIWGNQLEDIVGVDSMIDVRKEDDPEYVDADTKVKELKSKAIKDKEEKKRNDLIDKLKKQGLSDEQISERLEVYDNRQ